MTKKFIHVGFQKTGSTFLQMNYFEKHPELSYYPFTRRFPIELNQSLFKDRILISNENLIGRPWGYQHPPDRNTKNYSWLYDNEVLFKNLNNIMSVDGVIIGIREHSHLILSLYKQYLHEGGYKKFDDFFDLSKNNGIIKSEDLIFAKRISLIKKYLSKNIFIYDIADFRDYGKLEKRLNLFLGISNLELLTRSKLKKANKGVEGRNLKILRALNLINFFLLKIPFVPTLNNRLFKKLKITPRDVCQFYLSPLSGKKFKLSHNVEKDISSYYSDDYKKLLNN